MGVEFRILLYADSKEVADTAAEAAFGRIKQLNDIMSDYDAETELSQLSRTSGQGKKVRVSDDLWRVLERADALSRESNGSFDVTVGPCVQLWRKARREHKMPDPLKLEQARQAIGYKKMRLFPKEQSVELLVPNMRLDLGGIAKGYAVDAALRVLKDKGIKSVLIEGGGDFAVSAAPPGKKGWRIQVTPLDISNAPPARFLLLKNAAISTSGDLYQRLEIDGVRYSHIVDPHTGIGLTDHSLVNIIAPDSMTADSLTKVVSVLGPTKGLKFARKYRGVEVRIMRKPGEK